MVCQLIGGCLFLCLVVQCSGQPDLVGRCETCREVVKNFQKASSMLSITDVFVNIDYSHISCVWINVNACCSVKQ